MNEFQTTWQPKILSVLRFFAGFLMLWHGSQKLFNFPYSERGGADSAFMIFAGVLEFGGGLLIAIGLFTRWSAFLLSGTMAVAYWMAHGLPHMKNTDTQSSIFSLIIDSILHNPLGFLPIQNKGELAVLYCFVYLYLFFAGGGSWSLDNLLKKKD